MSRRLLFNLRGNPSVAPHRPLPVHLDENSVHCPLGADGRAILTLPHGELECAIVDLAILITGRVGNTVMNFAAPGGGTDQCLSKRITRYLLLGLREGILKCLTDVRIGWRTTSAAC